jgi:hypothetical protein
MKRRRLVASISVSFTIAATLLISQTMLISAQNRGARVQKGDHEGLQPHITYCYKVDSMDSRAKSDGVTSAVQTFKTE